jgi:YD repeat-containing protein
MNADQILILRARARRENVYDHEKHSAEKAEDEFCNELADTIERLTRERDEAREQTRYQYNRAEALEIERDEAEDRGYERGVKEAAKEIEKIAAIFDHPSVYMGGPSNHAKRRAKEIAATILALLEQSLPHSEKLQPGLSLSLQDKPT